MGVSRSVAVLMLAWSCGGCVVFQMRDAMRESNQQLRKMNGQLAQMNEQLTQMNGQLGTMNQQLAQTDQKLEPMRISMRRIDDELTAFRETIDKLNRYLPVNIRPETPPPAKQEPTRETTPTNK